MEIWAVAAYAFNKSTEVSHFGACLIRASSEDEATGMAFRIAKKSYPRSRGFMSHNVSISRDFTTPETAVPIEPEAM